MLSDHPFDYDRQGTKTTVFQMWQMARFPSTAEMVYFEEYPRLITFSKKKSQDVYFYHFHIYHKIILKNVRWSLIKVL